MIDFLDVQKELPSIGVRINRVGVKKINFPLKLGEDFAFLVIDLFVDIPETRKGADMSRAVESIHKVLNSWSDSERIGEIGIAICDEALSRFNYSEKSESYIEINYFKREKDRYLEYKIYLHSIKNRLNTLKNEIGMSYVTMTACPCAMETTRALISKDNPELSDYLISIPTVTHNQRNIIKLFVENKGNNISIWQLASIIENVQGRPLDSLLKRIDEGNLVYRAHKNPRFVEDVVREIAYVAANSLAIPDEAKIRVSSESDESIHPHNAFAELELSAGELRRISRK
ncbi:GTP cyclohydrolase I FolE2 [Thermoplasma sp. Kam2015]|uniref:GTP cyclohydrolase MptA n=1 Tax=Thermoplasma sp. Kam2015 TaxID=2094122 RepID=UPI000D818317|nr:GTP cyclohydrolase MptA [Thermoplasma sp. Kam2015]PYB67880.1 GTP cyclohydrolase I FolE2 [Thermoplasma sp. Kam2015]